MISSVERVITAERPWVFSDGHGLAALTNWYDDLNRLDEVDWDLVGARYWADAPEDNDRKRRKQAEFLVWEHLPWSAVAGIAVLNETARVKAESAMSAFPVARGTPVRVRSDWYYY